MTMNFSEIGQFQGEFKRLSKKYRSLPEDLDEFRKVVSAIPHGVSKHFAVLHREDDVIIIKARLFCRFLRGSSLRIVYAYHEQTEDIVFIELYYKGEKKSEDQKRIISYLRR